MQRVELAAVEEGDLPGGGALEILEPTAGHPLFSLTRGDWVKAGELRTGERLQTRSGAAQVVSVTASLGAQRVFNFEVEGEHEYLVGGLEVRSHNAAGTCSPGTPKVEVPGKRVSTPENRLPQDVRVKPDAPRVKSLDRPIGTSPTQNQAAQDLVARMQQEGWRDIRVNQQQVNADGVRVGTNRPDVQGTNPATNQREYFEFDRSSSDRGPLHEARLNANDPDALIHLLTVD